MRLIILFLIGSLVFSCKSIKKRTSDEENYQTTTEQQTTRDSTQRATRAQETIVSSAQVSEETITALQPLDSAGITVFKAYTRTVKYSDTSTTEQRDVDSTRNSVTDQTIGSEDIALTKASEMDKELESEPIIGPIADILFPSWLKIASMVLILIISCGFGLWQRRKNKKTKDQIDQNLT